MFINKNNNRYITKVYLLINKIGETIDAKFTIKENIINKEILKSQKTLGIEFKVKNNIIPLSLSLSNIIQFEKSNEKSRSKESTIEMEPIFPGMNYYYSVTLFFASLELDPKYVKSEIKKNSFLNIGFMPEISFSKSFIHYENCEKYIQYFVFNSNLENGIYKIEEIDNFDKNTKEDIYKELKNKDFVNFIKLFLNKNEKTNVLIQNNIILVNSIKTDLEKDYIYY